MEIGWPSFMYEAQFIPPGFQVVQYRKFPSASLEISVQRKLEPAHLIVEFETSMLADVSIAATVVREEARIEKTTNRNVFIAILLKIHSQKQIRGPWGTSAIAANPSI
jgi:hypothetical protein